LINFEPHEAELAMETYRTWLRLFQQIRYYSWIVDRFHISTQTYQYIQYGTTYDFGWLEQALKELGFRLIFCTRSAESFAQARAERVKVSGKPSQYDDLQVFIHEQEVMERFIQAARLDTLRVDISDEDVSRTVERIADWMENTGGLYVADK
jgi:thymidylate kinase